MQALKVGLAQIYPKIGDTQANEATHLEKIAEAAEQGVQLLVFPELSLTGYQLRDLVYEVAMTPDHPSIVKLRSASREHKIDLVVGYVDVGARGKFYIASSYIHNGEILHTHHKLYLPTYTMFDEGRFLAQGEHVRAFDTPFGRMGILICEDMWHVSPAYLMWLDGAEILIIPNSSPGRGVDTGDRLYSARWVELVMQAYASQFTDYVLHCNRVGFEDGVNFWGGSSVIDPDGEFLAKGPYFEEVLVVQSIDLGQIRRSRSKLPLLRDERTHLVGRELQRILENNRQQNKN
jgi:predicted amidohydrolase